MKEIKRKNNQFKQKLIAKRLADEPLVRQGEMPKIPKLQDAKPP